MALLFYSDDDDVAAWRQGLLAHLDDLDIRTVDEMGDPADIDMALVWKPPSGLLADLPKLGVIFSLAAGVDALLADDSLPDVPLCRMIDPSLTRGMSEYILYYVMRSYRHFDLYESQQLRAEWRLVLPPPPQDLQVGIMGLGELGTDAITNLAKFGFALRGWSRSRRELTGVNCFAGADELSPFLAGSDIVVCLLPLTPETTGLLEAKFFASMKPGSRLIHVGRGGQLVEADLLAALECGHLAGAVIDVTPIEPLPPTSGLWRHPKVVVTPHAAAYVQPETGAANLAHNIQRFRRGEPLQGLVDRSKGY